MKNQTSLLFFLVLLLSSCSNSNRFSIETSDDSIDFSIHRFDSDFILLDTTQIALGMEQLYAKYPTFMPTVIDEAFYLYDSDKETTNALILDFLRDTSFQAINRTVLETFEHTQSIEMSLKQSFQYIQHYFPNIQLPELYFFVSGFNRSIIIQPDYIAIGVDMYLGSDYPRYTDITYEYLTYNMRPESIPVDIISSILFNNFPANVTEDRLLDNMLHRGKVFYILSVFMPDEKPNDLIGYSKFQWEWCRKYEKEIWRTIVDQNHLYTSDLMLTRKYLNDAPFTAPISQDAPGRLGTWVGWQIVSEYMNQNKDMTLQDLMKENDYQKILSESGYNPK